MPDDYTPPKGDEVGLDLAGAYTPPVGDRVSLNLTNSPDGPPKDDQFIFPAPVMPPSPGTGTPVVRLAAEFIRPQGFSRTEVGIGGHVWNLRQVAAGAGAIVPANKYGSASVWLYTRYVNPTGANTAGYGTQ